MTAVRLTHIGGSTALIEVDGWRLLTDPTFDAPGRKYHIALGASTRKVTGPRVAVVRESFRFAPIGTGIEIEA